MVGVTQAGSAASEADGSGGTSLDGSPARGPEDHSQGCPSHHEGDQSLTAIREDMVTLPGETWCSRGEDRQSPSSKIPVVPGKKCCARGSLVGSFPDALHGEAPKGQPKNRGENLEAVRVEAPQGHPRNHRRQRKQHNRRPVGRKEQERTSARRRKAPPSSRWRMGEKGVGAPSRRPTPGELAAFWRT